MTASSSSTDLHEKGSPQSQSIITQSPHSKSRDEQILYLTLFKIAADFLND